ncbi:MAG: Hcp family type VI secretion system effector [Alphaproteobacteria bacterium]
MRIRSAVLSAVVGASIALSAAVPANAAGYLKIGDIKGESNRAAQSNGEVLAWSWGAPSAAGDKDHDKWIDLQSMSAGMSKPGAAAAAGPGGTGAGKVTIRKHVDKSSPKLAEACANGQVFDSVELSGASKDGKRAYLKYKLTNVMVTSYSVSNPHGSGDVPTEEISFYYNKVAPVGQAPAAAGTAVKPMRAAPATDYNSSRSNKSY